MIGATHEDDVSYDLELEEHVLKNMVKNAQEQCSTFLTTEYIRQRHVGTRAPTSDYAPFFGEIPGMNRVYTASGLGSTGLTSGPIVG